MVTDTKTKVNFACKIINREKLQKKYLSKKVNAFSLIEQEIAILKKLVNNLIIFNILIINKLNNC